MGHEDIKIAVSSTSFSRNEVLVKELLRVFPCARFSTEPFLKEIDLANFYQGCEGIVVGTERITRSILQLNPQITVLSKYGVGLNNLDLELLKESGIQLCVTPGINRNCVAELALTMMLSLCHRMDELTQLLRTGKWMREGGSELSSKTIGIIGCGNVGSRLIELLSPMKCRILVVDIENRVEFCNTHNARQVSLENLLLESEIISLHVPFTRLTESMVNQSFLANMNAGSLLINTSRGEVVCLDSLYLSLKEGHLGGAAVDVYAPEPPGMLKIFQLANLLPTPHIGGASKEARLAMGRAAIHHLVNYYSGARKKRGPSE
ncbi:hydroxyacid dehydrogenase [bacterium]|jgi:phosphoglycerate dehydrogenase-like enzyme|nr:hydroxyacid dehydrogenase [bacterium]